MKNSKYPSYRKLLLLKRGNFQLLFISEESFFKKVGFMNCMSGVDNLGKTVDKLNKKVDKRIKRLINWQKQLINKKTILAPSFS
jgi:hypothetical protein